MQRHTKTCLKVQRGLQETNITSFKLDKYVSPLSWRKRIKKFIMMFLTNRIIHIIYKKGTPDNFSYPVTPPPWTLVKFRHDIHFSYWDNPGILFRIQESVVDKWKLIDFKNPVSIAIVLSIINSYLIKWLGLLLYIYKYNKFLVHWDK